MTFSVHVFKPTDGAAIAVLLFVFKIIAPKTRKYDAALGRIRAKWGKPRPWYAPGRGPLARTADPAGFLENEINSL